jgi:hypothetical protein
VPSLRSSLRARARVAADRGLCDLPGAVVDTPEGPLFVRRRELCASHRHGTASVDSALRATGAAVAALALDASLSDFDPARALFLDTETTGLAGGAGTLPFLLGAAWFEGGAIVSEQWFLREPRDERVALCALARRLSAATYLVTFNGKSFDWPLLLTRFVLARLPRPPAHPHLDLLHAARRVYKRRLRDCRLTALESEVLGFVREGDVPGSMIPALYLDFLASGVAEPLAGVFEHNAHDLVAMVALLGDLHAAWSREVERPADDLVSMARIALRGHDPVSAEGFLVAAGEHAEALRLRARLCRPTNPARARDLLERAAPLDPTGQASLDLAKLLEHRFRDRPAALRHARDAADRGAEPPAAASRRLSRLGVTLRGSN